MLYWVDLGYRAMLPCEKIFVGLTTLIRSDFRKIRTMLKYIFCELSRWFVWLMRISRNLMLFEKILIKPMICTALLFNSLKMSTRWMFYIFPSRWAIYLQHISKEFAPVKQQRDQYGQVNIYLPLPLFDSQIGTTGGITACKLFRMCHVFGHYDRACYVSS